MGVVDVLRGLIQVNLDAFGPADPNDPYVAALPTFRTFTRPGDTTRDELILFRASAATNRALLLVATDTPSTLSSWDENNVPQVFRALNGSTTASTRRGFPTFTYGRNSTGRFMNVVLLGPGFREIVVPPNTPGFSTPSNVESMCQAAQAWAEANGHKAAFPCFTRAMVPGTPPGASLGHVLVVFPAMLRGVMITSKLPAGSTLAPRWTCRDLPIVVSNIVEGDLGPDDELPDLIWLPKEEGLAVVENGGAPVLFYVDDTGLVQVTPDMGPPVSIDPDAAGTRRVSLSEIGSVSAQAFAAQTHIVWGGGQVFHAQRPDTGTATFTYRKASATGAPSGIGQYCRATVSPADTLHVLAYVPRGWNDDSQGQSLLHLTFDGAMWTQTVVDGDGRDGATDGHVAGDCGAEAAATFEPDGTMHAFYLLRRMFGSADETFQLRHAELGLTGWQAETLDGAGSTVTPTTPGTGPTTAHVGFSPAAVYFDGGLWVVYEDRTYGNLRCARGVRGTDRKLAWEFHVVDGSVGRGRTTDTVRTVVAQVWDNMLSLVYADISRKIIRHALRAPKAKNWRHEVLDGVGGVDGRAVGKLRAPIAIAARRQADGTSSLPLFVVYGSKVTPGNEFRLATLTAQST